MKAVKIIVAFVLCLIIISVPIGIYLIRFDNNSLIGNKLKDRVIISFPLLNLLNLNEPGDAKFYYSDSRYPKIRVNLGAGGKNNINIKVSLWIDEMILETLNKDADLRVLDEDIFVDKIEYTDQDLNEVRKTVLDKTITKDPFLNIIYLSKYAEKPTSIGVVIHRDTIFIFKERLEKLTEKGYVGQILEKTTIMHEWGHLLGLEHINESGCIMNELVEVPEGYPSEKELPREYCREELRIFDALNRR